MGDTLAIVIPVGPGESAWQQLLPDLELDCAAEIAVVLCSESPAVPVPLTNERLRLAVSRAGRAEQQNAGAAMTTARWLWFLHADSRFAPDTLPRLYDFLARNEQVLGYFDLQFQGDGPRWMSLNALGARIRSRWLGLPFGDQGLVVPRRLFEALGGFDETLPGGEDHALVWQSKRLDIPLQPIGAPLLTSARKYATNGWWRTTTRHLRLTCQQAWAYSRVAGAR